MNKIELTPEVMDHLLDMIVVGEPWEGLPPDHSVADWLVGPQGVLTTCYVNIDLGGVDPVFARLILTRADLTADRYAWACMSARQAVERILAMAQRVIDRQGLDLRPWAFFRLITVDGTPTPQFCCVDERDPLWQARYPTYVFRFSDKPGVAE